MNEAFADEPALWAAALEQSDGVAFGKLFDRHRDRVFRHALYHLENVADAEDATATAFLELWRGRQRVQLIDGSVLPWLLGITTNTARNVSRARRRYRQLLDRLPREAPDFEDPTDRAVATIETAQAMRSVASVLGALPPDDAALISLTALEGYSADAAAAVVGITPGAARTRLHRLRRRLRLKIEQDATEVTS